MPLLYVFLIIEYAGRFLFGHWKPVVTVETPPGAYLNVVFVTLGVLMLFLSLRGAGEADARREGELIEDPS